MEATTVAASLLRQKQPCLNISVGVPLYLKREFDCVITRLLLPTLQTREVQRLQNATFKNFDFHPAENERRDDVAFLKGSHTAAQSALTVFNGCHRVAADDT
jgi:hypothetical protein